MTLPRCVSLDNWSSSRSRWAAMRILRTEVSGAESTSFTSATGISRSRKRRIT